MGKTKIPKCEFRSEGNNFFVLMDGVKIAMRGQPGTPQAGTWTAIEPGWQVYDSADGSGLVVEHKGVRAH